MQYANDLKVLAKKCDRDGKNREAVELYNAAGWILRREDYVAKLRAQIQVRPA